jgi:hypothetical protein
MTSRRPLPLEAAIALAEQHYRELVSICAIDRLAEGDFGEGPQRARVEALLDKMNGLIVQIQSALSERVRSDETPIMSLVPSHAHFLRTELLPHAKIIQKASFTADGLADLFDILEDESLDGPHTIKNALWFTTDYADNLLDDEDERRLSVEIAQETLEQQWFQPDFWSSNLRMLRPALLGKGENAIPTRIKVRLAEMQKAFVFGAWMATIALSRAIAEFVLVERGPSLGVSPVRKASDGSERYLKLDDLIEAVSRSHQELERGLRVLQDAGNRVLHPRKRQNVIPTPKVLRSEAYDCVKETLSLVEALYAK